MTSRRANLKNEGSFEGYVGKDPTPVQNRRDVPQCFLAVGHTEGTIDEKGKWKRGKTVWVHFACFERQATFALKHIQKGSRVLVDYDLTTQPDRHLGSRTSFRAVRIRPIGDGFAPRNLLEKDGDELWRPPKPKEGTWDAPADA